MIYFKGGLFHGDDDLTQIAFKYAVERINSMSSSYYLIPKMYNISRIDSFKAQKIGKIRIKTKLPACEENVFIF